MKKKWMYHVKHAKMVGNIAIPTNSRGAKRTKPLHGKENRIPYVANNSMRKRSKR